MNIFSVGLLYHVATVQRLLRKYELEGLIGMKDFVLQVRGRNRYYRFYPQFIWDDEKGRPHYAPELVRNTRAFVGWRPYFNKRWPIGCDKFAFKAYCEQTGMATPRMWRTPSPDMRDFVVKQSELSFGQGLRGPFKAYAAGDPAMQVAPATGYYEAFVPGRIVKAWYWQDRLAAVEVKSSPTVTGDGKRTLRQLVSAILRPSVPEDEWPAYAEVAAYQGLTLDSIVPAGRTVMADFRYGTFAEPLDFQNRNMLDEMADGPLVKQLREIGPTLWQGIPEDLRDASLYAVDGILDNQDRLWLLEVNCNPVAHPDTYDFMLETLFGRPDTKANAPIPRSGALPPYVPLGAPPLPGAAVMLPPEPVPVPMPEPTRAPPEPSAAALRPYRWLS